MEVGSLGKGAFGTANIGQFAKRERQYLKIGACDGGGVARVASRRGRAEPVLQFIDGEHGAGRLRGVLLVSLDRGWQLGGYPVRKNKQKTKKGEVPNKNAPMSY